MYKADAEIHVVDQHNPELINEAYPIKTHINSIGVKCLSNQSAIYIAVLLDMPIATAEFMGVMIG